MNKKENYGKHKNFSVSKLQSHKNVEPESFFSIDRTKLRFQLKFSYKKFKFYLKFI